MDLFVLVVTSLVNIVLGLLVYLRNRRGTVNKVFLLFILSVVVWTSSNFFVDRSESYSGALFWTKITFIASYYIASFLYFFSFVFPNRQLKQSRKIFYLFTPALFLTAATFTDLVIGGVKDISIHPIAPTFGPLYYFFVLYFLVYIALTFVNLLKRFRQSIGIQKAQIKYLILGLFIAVIFGVTTNLILPLFNYSSLSNFGVYSTIFFFIFTTYAIVKHRLLDVRLVISKSLLYIILVALVSFVLTLSILLARTVLAEIGGSQLISSIIVALVIVFGLDPLKKWIARLTDKVFFKAPIDYQEVLRQLSEKISIEAELDKLITTVGDGVTGGLKLKHADILLADGYGNMCRRHPITGLLTPALLKDGEVVQYLTKKRSIIERTGLERKLEDTRSGPEQEKLKLSLERVEALDAALISPITAQNQLNAVLVLGPKLSGDTFSVEELRLFTVLGPQIGSAIEKAKLFDEVKSFSNKLQIEVDRATRELKERNQFLLSLQEITSLITHSLDYKKVTQQIVDGIARQLGYIGGILMLADKTTGETWAEAITDTPVTRAAIKILPKPVAEYRGSINDVDLTTKAMRTGEIQESDRLSDFLHPPLPTMLCDALQKLARIRYLVTVPIYSEEQIIGALAFAVGKGKHDITRQEVSMMKSLADQAGIVMRNLRLFEGIQKANAELEKANEHLRTLDEAKSEFISIASHQLRTPMTGIMGYLSMLVGGDFGKLDPKIGNILSQILDASKRMIRLINIFLNISKIEAGRFELDKKPVQFANIIETEFVELKKLADDKGLKLTFKKPKPPLPEVMVDRDKLADVVQNLVDNAIKYTEKGSVAVSASTVDGMIRIDVKDTGRGLKNTEVGKLFNKFVRGDGIARIHPDGSGLGLYIAKKIVESHNGRIWVESEGEGKGSTFSFVVPVR